ncbi:GldG family protein [Ruminococcus sp.]|uniref:GldG family protein n=1 Tax=Ruminococcus sp. TaxID=41978 RepID=UPI001B1CB81A|nr:GldG family protein [Ruminococcus sp.]MBO5558598.1 GldG family protein [Ruminococcus sp.]
MAQKETAKPKKARSFTAAAMVFGAIALAIVILLNLMVSRLNVIWDMTPTGMYKLTQSTRDYLESVDKKVNFYFLFDMDVLSTDTDSMPLYNAMKEYSEYDCINFQAFDPDSDPDKTKELQNMGFTVSQGDIVIECEGRTKHIPAYTMFETHTSSDNSGKQATSSVYFTGENIITGAIEAVVTGKEVKIYFLTGHSEKQIDTDFTTLKTNLASRNYIAEPLNLTTGSSVPEDASIVIVASPKTDITDNELKVLNDYLDKGGNICFWMAPNEDTVEYTNIESILADFSISMDYDRVTETDTDLYPPNDPTSFLCSIVVADQTSSIDLTSELAQFVDQGAQPFMTNTRSFMQIYNEGNNNEHVTTGSLLQTIDKIGDGSSTAVGEPMGGSKPRDRITDVVLDLAMYSTDSSRAGAKIMVMGNGDFLDDDNIYQAYMTIPVNLQLSVFSWMYDSDKALDFGIAGKERTFDEMNIESTSKANVINVIFIAVPVVVGLIGGAVWLRRRYSE